MPCWKKIDKVSQATLCLPRTAPTALSIRSSGSSARANSSRQAFFNSNRVVWKCSIKGAPLGSLKSKKVVIKDNVCVASVPIVNGSNGLEGYVPELDATIVRRILVAGR
jgi:amidase